MLNIVVPMAGKGSRFSAAGYSLPKPLLPLGGKPMIQWVIENIKPACEHKFIFICQAAHLAEYPEVKDLLMSLCPSCELVEIEGVTEGAACTVLLASACFDSDTPLMIANTDQYVDYPIDDYLETLSDQKADGLIMTFDANHPKWSYCGMRDDGTVSRVVEKEVISNEATVGIYNFARGRDFVSAAEEMIRQDLRVNGEFYVAPVYNHLIDLGAKILVCSIGSDQDGMYGLGTPEDYLTFQETDAYHRNISGSRE